MFLERRTSVKMNHNVFNLRVNIKLTGFSLSIRAWFIKPFDFRLHLER